MSSYTYILSQRITIRKIYAKIIKYQVFLFDFFKNYVLWNCITPAAYCFVVGIYFLIF